MTAPRKLEISIIFNAQKLTDQIKTINNSFRSKNNYRRTLHKRAMQINHQLRTSRNWQQILIKNIQEIKNNLNCTTANLFVNNGNCLMNSICLRRLAVSFCKSKRRNGALCLIDFNILWHCFLAIKLIALVTLERRDFYLSRFSLEYCITLETAHKGARVDDKYS